MTRKKVIFFLCLSFLSFEGLGGGSVDNKDYGLKLDSDSDVVVNPEIAFFYMHDDNVFNQHDNERSDDIYGVSGLVRLYKEWGKYKVNGNAGFESGRYSEFDSEEYDDYWLAADARVELSLTTDAIAAISFSEEHEDRGSPDEQFGIEPTTYSIVRGHLGLEHDFDLFSGRLITTYETYDFDDVRRIDGADVNNDDRDRELLDVGVRLDYELAPDSAIFAQAIAGARSYRDRQDDYGYQRDSDGGQLHFGVETDVSSRVKAEGYVGYMRQSYDDTRFDTTEVVDFGGELTWRLSSDSTLSGYVRRSIEETTLPGSSGYLLTMGGVELQRRLSANDFVTAHMMVGEEDYEGISREDDLFEMGLSYRRFISSNFYVDASYRLSGRDSSEERLGDVFGNAANAANRQEYEDYYSNAVYFSLGTLLYPSSSRPASVMPLLDYGGFKYDWGGLYLGAQYTHGVLLSQVDGVRDKGTSIAEYGDTGYGHGAFLGYGWRAAQWYFGVEGNIEDSSASFRQGKSKPEAQQVSVEKGDSYGFGVRTGYILPSQSLIYARLGWADTDFETDNRVNNQPSGYNDTDTLSGILYGVGVDMPLGNDLFIRMDYSLTDYDKQDITYLDNSGSPVPATFDNDELLFRLGLGWYLGGQSQKRDSLQVERSGWYSGVQLGHGASGSKATGIHNSSGVASDFSGEFSDGSGLDVSGFIGYGLEFDPWYVSLETELDAGNSDWARIREPTGRTFKVDKKGSYGLFLRAGYSLDNGVLLYSRLGRVKTKFNTEWDKGHGVNSFVDRDDNVWGDRFGIGAEIPIAEKLSVRLDYSVTDYDTYGFVTSNSNYDSMEFDNEESLFRIGMMFGF